MLPQGQALHASGRSTNLHLEWARESELGKEVLRIAQSRQRAKDNVRIKEVVNA